MGRKNGKGNPKPVKYNGTVPATKSKREVLHGNPAPMPTMTRMSQTHVQLNIGPIPPADECAKYEAIMPGAMKWFCNRSDIEQLHRHKIEDKDEDSDIRDRPLGMILTTIVGLGLFTVVVFFIIYNYHWQALGLVTAVVGSIIGSNIYSTKRKYDYKQNELKRRFPTEDDEN